MKKASDILLLIGAIFTIFAAIGCLIGMIVLFVFASPNYTQVLVDAIKSGEIHSDVQGSAEEIAAVLQLGFRFGGIGCLVATLCEVAVVVVAFVARAKQTTGLYIASLVLGVLGGSLLVLLGSIFGLVGLSEEKKAA